MKEYNNRPEIKIRRKKYERGYSIKPDCTRDRIVELVGDISRIELFARQAPKGWDVWGNEVA